MVYVSKKGSIIIAFLFVIILTITAASYFIMIGGRSAFTANQLKRAQAINCAEAGLYETFNRFRAGGLDPTVDIPSATNYTINVPTAIDPNVPVTISYNAATKQISAAVDYDDITM